MRQAKILVHDVEAGILEEINQGKAYRFYYHENYLGPPISLTMPISKRDYEFSYFPPFFEGLLPEGMQLEGLLKHSKIDKNDYFQQLISAGEDLVGAVTVKEGRSE